MSSLSVQDLAALRHLSNDAITTIVCLCIASVLWIHFALVVKAGQIMLDGERRSRASVLLYSIVLTIFLINTTACVMNADHTIRELNDTLASTSSASIADRYLSFQFPSAAEGALLILMLNLGDVVIVWRVYAFWRVESRERWIVLLPAVLLIGSFATSGLIIFCDAKLSQYIATDYLANPPFCKHVQLSSYAMTAVTTVVATALIAYKTWEYRRTVALDLCSATKRPRLGRIMIILLESGAVYFVLSLTALLENVGDVGARELASPSLAFARQVWAYVSNAVMAIYPAMIVILVHRELSYIESATSLIRDEHLQVTV